MSYFGSIYADQELSHRARTVYMYLKDRSDAGNTCWPSVRRILKSTVSQVYVKKGQASLLLKNGQIIERRA